MEKKPRPKMVYQCRNAVLTKASDLWPNRTDTEGVYVLVGEYRYRDTDQWNPLRSSMVINYHPETQDYETMNSIYRITDGKVPQNHSTAATSGNGQRYVGNQNPMLVDHGIPR